MTKTSRHGCSWNGHQFAKIANTGLAQAFEGELIKWQTSDWNIVDDIWQFR